MQNTQQYFTFINVQEKKNFFNNTKYSIVFHFYKYAGKKIDFLIIQNTQQYFTFTYTEEKK